MTAPVRVVIADDHPMFLYGLRPVLSASAEVEVVGEAADGAELVSLVMHAKPDVVLTDLAMPGLDGATAARQILDQFPDIGVLVLTMHEDDEALFGALRAGARGYLLKGSDREEIVRAVLAVASGDAVYSAGVARHIVDFFTSAHQTYAAQVFPELTGREREILDLVAAGLGNHEIARRLLLSEKTVRNNVAAILTKLQVPNRAAAVAKARDTGLGTRASALGELWRAFDDSLVWEDKAGVRGRFSCSGGCRARQNVRKIPDKHLLVKPSQNVPMCRRSGGIGGATTRTRGGLGIGDCRRART
jgi:DNA-binding NarL/FixJ family response regulator